MSLRASIPAVLLLCLAARTALAAEAPLAKGMFGAGVNYPGVGVRYLLADRTALELKDQAEKHVQVAGSNTSATVVPATSALSQPARRA